MSCNYHVYGDHRAQVQEKLDEVIKLFQDIESFCDATGTSFSWDYCGYGMSGRYEPRSMSYAEAVDLLRSGATLTHVQRLAIAAALERGYDAPNNEGGWRSSSSDC